MRCAIYFIPPREHMLAAAAASWLRRDPCTGAGLAGTAGALSEEEHAFLTAAPRRYGFHATIKAPFRLAGGATIEGLCDRLDGFVRRLLPIDLELELASIDGFFALVPAAPAPGLDDLAASVVAEFDSFRAPQEDHDLARRNVSRLSGRQLSHLVSWGYPYVFDEFRFHMTLTGLVPPDEHPRVRQAIESHFGTTRQTLEFSQLAIAIEPEDHAPFLVHSVHPFAAASSRLRA
jgi:putative phosphonate metabolism protein